MADYFTHFSCLLDVGTPDKAARALALFQSLREADLDLSRFRSVFLRAILAIKETGYGSNTQR